MTDQTNDELDRALQRQLEAFTGILDRRLDEQTKQLIASTDVRIDELARLTSGGFAEVSARLDGVDERLDKLERRVDRLDERVAQIGGEMRSGFLDHDRRLKKLEGKEA
jgi:hypothetical protein